MRNRLAKLIDVKTLVTFALTAVFSYLSVKEKVEPQLFMTIYTMVIGFYFGTQSNKIREGKKDES